jgi:hypothetical protein
LFIISVFAIVQTPGPSPALPKYDSQILNVHEKYQYRIWGALSPARTFGRHAKRRPGAVLSRVEAKGVNPWTVYPFSGL